MNIISLIKYWNKILKCILVANQNKNDTHLDYKVAFLLDHIISGEIILKHFENYNNSYMLKLHEYKKLILFRIIRKFVASKEAMKTISINCLHDLLLKHNLSTLNIR